MGFVFDFLSGKGGFGVKVGKNTVLGSNGTVYHKVGKTVLDSKGKVHFRVGNKKYIGSGGHMHWLNKDPFGDK